MNLTLFILGCHLAVAVTAVHAIMGGAHGARSGRLDRFTRFLSLFGRAGVLAPLQ